ncbi:hypothetical protein N658DRAFT_493433 [Parathielavia hyrcaniae]|uniref:Uncharacterized protein n=1 Tax=Parathielavia hyrcaniae TaxID=113614 RepID=A0AAN6Q5H9_9PEZI|nr:hypothetical protein N658DRAFT_493433 [Parathielavia hyrcaniae]
MKPKPWGPGFLGPRTPTAEAPEKSQIAPTAHDLAAPPQPDAGTQPSQHLISVHLGNPLRFQIQETTILLIKLGPERKISEQAAALGAPVSPPDCMSLGESRESGILGSSVVQQKSRARPRGWLWSKGFATRSQKTRSRICAKIRYTSPTVIDGPKPGVITNGTSRSKLTLKVRSACGHPSIHQIAPTQRVQPPPSKLRAGQSRSGGGVPQLPKSTPGKVGRPPSTRG